MKAAIIIIVFNGKTLYFDLFMKQNNVKKLLFKTKNLFKSTNEASDVLFDLENFVQINLYADLNSRLTGS